MSVLQAEQVELQAGHQQPQIWTVAGEDEEDFLNWKPGREELMILACLAIVSLVVALDGTVLVPVLPTIASDLHGDTNEAYWVGTAYLLSCAVFQPLFVALSDVLGRQSVLFLSLVLFTIGTLICCLSHGMAELLVGRTLQGVGGGGILCQTFVITTDIIPLRQRPAYSSIVQVAFVVGTVTGPLIGGLLVDHSTWRWVFYLNFPFMGVGLVMLRSIDWVGAALFMASVSSFLIGITWGGGQFAWSSWQTLLPVCLGLVGVIITIFWLKKGAQNPFLRLVLFRDISSRAMYFCAVFQGLLMFCELYSLPLYLEGPKDMSLTMTGVALMTITGSLMPVSLVVGIIITKSGHIRWALWTGWVLIATSTGLLILLDSDTKTYAWALIFLSVGMGHGCIIVSSSMCVQALAEAKDSAQAASMYTFLRSFGMCLGVAVGSTVTQNRLHHQLQIRQLPLDIAENAQGFIASLRKTKSSYSPSFIYSVNTAYVQSLKNLFEVLVAVAGLGLIAALFLKSVNMNKRLDTQHRLQRKIGLDREESVACDPAEAS
ncbi:major facilitator superfamily-domain-containing protein [Penicillium daleae]|uniref:Major facilitator superfamily-domain-containing protein n=1 Tax=Penicillium daleae TaxID=63821 RepID=A0AAD6CCV7_9EURO|nr:major facilitator superfamily-domain-containing protein [Penicillium daleae]KAJ5460768.1 major facilitator superfamily-domain-containing protein [Penicillium daleae]